MKNTDQRLWYQQKKNKYKSNKSFIFALYSTIESFVALRLRSWEIDQWPVFKSSLRLYEFHITLMPVGGVWLKKFSSQLLVNIRTDYIL